MGPKLLSHNLKSLTAKEVPVYNTILYNWPNIFSPVFTVQLNDTEAWMDYNAGHHHSKHHADLNISPSTVHNLSRTLKMLKVKLEMKWHGTIQITFSQVKTEVSSKNLPMSQIILSTDRYRLLFWAPNSTSWHRGNISLVPPVKINLGLRLVLIQLCANGPLTVNDFTG